MEITPTIISDAIMFGVLVLQALTVAGFVALVFAREKVSVLIGGRALALAFMLAGLSILGSFYYSEILGFEPCRLCIYQRWLMIALLIVTGIAAHRGDRNAFPYIAGISFMGLAVAIYQIFLPFFKLSYICAPGEVSCTANYVTGFGYITIPVISLTVFAAMLLVCAAQRRSAGAVV